MNIPKQGTDRHDWEEVSVRGAYVAAEFMVDQPSAVEVRAVLDRCLNWRSDHQMSLRTLLIGMYMVGILDWRCHHRKVRKALRSLPYETQRKLNLFNRLGEPLSYRVIAKAIGEIARVLADPPVLVEHDHPVADEDTGEVFPCPATCPFMVAGPTWFDTGMALAAIPAGIPLAQDIAIDWTDMPTNAKDIFRFKADPETSPDDSDPDYHMAAMIDAGTPKKTTAVAPIGPDGRKVPSKDTDARRGHRSARPGMSEWFIGFDVDTALGTPAYNGTMFAPFIFGAVVRPAGSYAGDAAVELLRTMRYFGLTIRDVNADRGYTRLDYERFGRPILQIADNIVMDLTENQARRKADWTVVRDKGKPEERTIHVKRIGGGFFTNGMPDTVFDNLSRPGHNADKATRLASMAEFDKRAAYAFVPHDFTKAGTRRWAGPATATAGYKVRCANNPSPGPKDGVDLRPITNCKKGKPCSCGEILAIDDPETERERQKHLWGTTKWTKSYNRRTVVERGYSDDKVQITSLDRKHICCFGTIKHAIYYAPIAAARNLAVALRWYYDTGQPDPWEIEKVSRPDYRLPEEPPVGCDGAHDQHGADSPELAALISAATEPKSKNRTASTLVLDSPAAPPLNRKQRRAAERSARTGRRANSKPPKPPPRDTPPPDRQ